MTRTKKYLTFFVFINILFVFLLIYKQSCFTKTSYDQQILEQQRKDLLEEEMLLTRELYELKNPKKINEYATKKLGMKKMGLRQAKKISPEGIINSEEN
jgi:cell division protein FtsL